MIRSLLAIIVLLVGCGGALENPSPDAQAPQTDGPLTDATAEAATDGPSGQDALGCGGQTCADNQICVVEYCGGGPVQCTEPGDGGQCPDGWTFQSTSCPANGGTGGCFPPPCVSPPPHCADRPAGCGADLSCACVPSATCDGISCSTTWGRTVTCANA
jgi:hypothetical protein